MEEPSKSTIAIIHEAHTLTCKTKAKEELKLMYRASKCTIKLIRGGSFPLPKHFPFKKNLSGARASDSTKDSLGDFGIGIGCKNPSKLPLLNFTQPQKCPFLSKKAAVFK